jgi:hypothetical protein
MTHPELVARLKLMDPKKPTATSRSLQVRPGVPRRPLKGQP